MWVSTLVMTGSLVFMSALVLMSGVLPSRLRHSADGHSETATAAGHAEPDHAQSSGGASVVTMAIWLMVLSFIGAWAMNVLASASGG